MGAGGAQAVNERIYEIALRYCEDVDIDYLCECGCMRIVKLSRHEYVTRGGSRRSTALPRGRNRTPAAGMSRGFDSRRLHWLGCADATRPRFRGLASGLSASRSAGGVSTKAGPARQSAFNRASCSVFWWHLRRWLRRGMADA